MIKNNQLVSVLLPILAYALLAIGIYSSDNSLEAALALVVALIAVTIYSLSLGKVYSKGRFIKIIPIILSTVALLGIVLIIGTRLNDGECKEDMQAYGISRSYACDQTKENIYYLSFSILFATYSVLTLKESKRNSLNQS